MKQTTQLGFGSVKATSWYRGVCWRTIDGRPEVVWEGSGPNIVVTAGLNQLLNATFIAGTTSPAWYVGLTDGGSAPTYAAGDTMASHAGWTENTGYSGNRKVWTAGSVSGGSVDNSANQASFSMSTTGTIAGAFLCSLATGNATTNTLYGEANFGSGNRSVLNGDTLAVTVTLTVS